MIDITSEHQEQVALIGFCTRFRAHVPELALLFAIPNGEYRAKASARRLKAEGVRAGVPDLFLPVARCGFHGLFIELKRSSGGRVSPAQTAMITALRAQGYGCYIACGWVEAAAYLVRYLGHRPADFGL